MFKTIACSTGSAYGDFTSGGLICYGTNMVVLLPPFGAVVLNEDEESNINYEEILISFKK
jgi:hypothetical protein